MGKLVEPKVFLVGYTDIDEAGLMDYLHYTGQEGFLGSYQAAKEAGISAGEILCSIMAKLCYKSLVLGKNDNITRTRDIPDNIRGIFDSGHGSVLEHAQINFIVTDCSRVFTHELVRHRVGTAFSQTSGRYVRGDSVDLVYDPILDPVKEEVITFMGALEAVYQKLIAGMKLNEMKDFALKKKSTSALRRILPNGQSNEIGFSVNFRALRHLVQLRTSGQAEKEIRQVFGQIYRLTKARFPLLYHGAVEEEVDGLLQVSGMKMQPYEK